MDLGEHRLKDFGDPVWIFQLGTDRFPPIRTISNTNLPRPASSFVGREREVAEIAAHLRDGARFVTLTGPGGSGKTRLAIEAASELVPSFRNGVFWVALAPIQDPSLVLSSIAETIGAKEDLAAHLVEREVLLLLDNFEQVVDASLGLPPLLESCPNLRLMVTSRELLRVRGEVEYPVLPLADDEAVELFSARSGWEPDAMVTELCRRLDDLPLAVELAARRANVLSPAQILDRLGARLDLLRGGRDADARQQTLAPRSSGAMSSSRRRNGPCSRGWPSSRAAPRSRPRKPSARRISTPWDRSWVRASFATTASGSGCSRRSGSSRPSGSSHPAKPRTFVVAMSSSSWR
jgi:hypothetical protein